MKLLLFSILSISFYAHSETLDYPNLLIDIDEPNAKNLLKSNHKQVIKGKYFDKNKSFRIVKIDFGLLRSDEPFLIDGSDDAWVVVQKTDGELDPTTNVFTWEGKVIAPKASYMDDNLGTILNNIRIRVRPFTIKGRSKKGLETNPPQVVTKDSELKSETSTYQTIYGSIVLGISGERLMIRPLANNPDYHMVFIYDNAKAIDDSDPELVKRINKEYKEYLRSNGLDPEKDF